MARLHFSERRQQGPWFHLTTVRWARNQLPGLHDHDYPEIFWLTQGQCEHRINGRLGVLPAGRVVLMRAADRHVLRPAGHAGFAFTNLSIHPEILADLLDRLGPEIASLYDAVTPMPAELQLSDHDLGALQEETRQLAAQAHTRFRLERFLLNLWARFVSTRPALPATGDVPDWLQEACLAVQEPDVFAGGVGGFVEACGRSHEHVARLCRKHFARSPREIVNEARMLRASNDLRTTSQSVTEIALACGFADCSTFFRLFKARFGVTPRHYRRSRGTP